MHAKMSLDSGLIRIIPFLAKNWKRSSSGWLCRFAGRCSWLQVRANPEESFRACHLLGMISNQNGWLKGRKNPENVWISGFGLLCHFRLFPVVCNALQHCDKLCITGSRFGRFTYLTWGYSHSIVKSFVSVSPICCSLFQFVEMTPIIKNPREIAGSNLGHGFSGHPSHFPGSRWVTRCLMGLLTSCRQSVCISITHNSILSSERCEKMIPVVAADQLRFHFY